ncbi:MAG TPA: chromate efflux transporter [Candidatus Limnocylindria bacterium]|nr:chromate efflux transporter [Candidatus Limnocylindria bacterium]
MTTHAPPPRDAGLEVVAGPPHEPYGRLFARFLRFGFNAWGGPVAQIDMLRKELVEDERWVGRSHFSRVLAVYQVLPGPEATELCVYFGTIARGRLGGVLAGLGFVLPGFVLMLALSWLYLTYGIAPAFDAAFRGAQAAVVALIVRAVHRIGKHTMTDRWLWAIAGVSGIASLLGVHFAITLGLAGVAYVLVRRGHHAIAIALGIVALAGVLGVAYVTDQGAAPSMAGPAEADARTAASLPALFWSGLRAGLLTFGGAYTVIPFLQHDAVMARAWMTNAEFLDGLALSGILPAPLIIFATFIGYFAGGLAGTVVITFAIFAPAFGFTLVGHELIERIVEHPGIRDFLYGVTAGVVGLIAATTVGLFRAAITGWQPGLIFLLVLVLLYRWPVKASVPVAVVGAAGLGALLLGR